MRCLGMSGPDRALPVTTWLDRFFRWHHEHHPVSATFIGVHEHDHRLPDPSEAGVAATLAEARVLLEQAPEPGSADGFEALDLRLAVGALRIRTWELESGHMVRNPSLHVAEAVFGAMSLLLTDFAPIDERLEALTARLSAVPGFLEAAGAGLADAPAAWIERARRECRGALSFLELGVPTLTVTRPGLAEAAASAATAFRRYAARLEEHASRAGGAPVSAGADALALHLAEAHFLREPAEDLAARARSELGRSAERSAASARRLGAPDAAGALASLADAHPSADRYLARFGEIWRDAKATVERAEALTWPDFPIRYVPRPAWSRAAAPDLYFLPYRSPAAYGRPRSHDYLVAPVDDARSAAEREALLRSHSDYVIKSNHVVHHGGVGHHVQNWHAFRSPSRVGRVAAVDAAARIAMLCGGTMAEGWACYATDLVAELGGFEPLERFAHEHGRARMCARAVVDVELHSGRMSLEEAAELYRRHAGMSPAAARAEAVKNSMFPGGALMYLAGTDTIHGLRAALEAELGGAFSMRAFHDAFLSYGSVPVRLVAEEMTTRARRGEPLGAHERPFLTTAAPS